ncbi:hypothetical protein KM043_010587 [Ampulex compressa]|nr:hypothetical protein KM043_010587 [Ampulex compressa]
MFWTNNYVSSPHIEALLNKEDVTLHELMDEDEILAECKGQNKKLVEYLTRPEVMEELITLTTREPSIEIEERWRYKYPNVACELLTCDVPTLNEKLAGDQALLEKLYSFIDTDEPLNPLLASFFSKTIGVLVARNSDQNWYSYQFTCLQVLEFLKSRQRCVDLLLQHIETSAIMDLVLKLVTQVEGSDMRQNILTWLDSQQLVQRLVKLLSPSSEWSKHANASQLLCDMVTVARENQRTSTERADPDPILNTLESGETVALLLETILTGEKLESSIVGGIQVLLALLGQKTNTALNEGDVHGNGITEDVTDNEQRVKISNATLPYLDQLHKLLLDPPYKPPIRTTAGLLECPLGSTRLHVAKLLVALLTTENLKIHETLVDLGTFQTLLDLFFKYTWNNFLHTQVQQCLALAINYDYQDTNDVIYANIFIKCRLIDRILEAWDKNESKQNKENGVRQGYMGHLINIADNIVNQCEKYDILDNFLKTNLSTDTHSKWTNFVTKELAEINKTHQIFLGEQTQDYMTMADDNQDEYNSYSQQAYVAQIYSTYQEEEMTSEFAPSFGFYNDESNNGDDALHNSVDQLTTLAFTLSEEDLDKREDLFNRMCQQRQKAGLEDCGSGVEWGDEGELTFQTVVDKRDWPSKQQHNDSNSSDEDDDDPRDMHMEVDSTDPWDSAEPLPNNTALPEVNPWEVTPAAESVESTGWANFDNFESTLNSEKNMIIDNKSCKEEKIGGSDGPVESNEEKTTSENKVCGDTTNVYTGYVTPRTDTAGTGDTEINESIGSTTTRVNERNLNEKTGDENLYSVCTADKNANPSEPLGSRESASCDGKAQDTKDQSKVIIGTEKATCDNKIACSVGNKSPEMVVPPKDCK